MAVEEIEKLVDIPFNFVSRKVKKTVYITSDGTEFEVRIRADQHEKYYFLMKEFKEYFSEEKNNFRVGTKELNNSLWNNEDREDDYVDYFWVRIENTQEKEILKNFCMEFYSLDYSNLFYEEDCSDMGWIYLLIIKNSEVFWVSKKQLENSIKIIQNNFPENIKTKKIIIKKKKTRAELIDI